MRPAMTNGTFPVSDISPHCPFDLVLYFLCNILDVFIGRTAGLPKSRSRYKLGWKISQNVSDTPVFSIKDDGDDIPAFELFR